MTTDTSDVRVGSVVSVTIRCLDTETFSMVTLIRRTKGIGTGGPFQDKHKILSLICPKEETSEGWECERGRVEDRGSIRCSQGKMNRDK